MNQEVEKLWELQTVLSQLGEREQQLTDKPESFASVDREWQSVNAQIEQIEGEIETLSRESVEVYLVEVKNKDWKPSTGLKP